jgi:hypothetical protein
MKGDFSRQTFDRAKHYSAVLKQQGRVDVDADWNEQQAINRHRVETEAIDVIGHCGAPVNDAGFEITANGKTLKIGKGRYYVDGILCENEEDLAYDQQPDLLDPSKVISLLSKTKNGVVYLDVWQRHITALDDDLVREKALGGPDTATRRKTVWQVKVLPITRQPFKPDFFRNHIIQLSSALTNVAKGLDPLVHGESVKVVNESKKSLRPAATLSAENALPIAKTVLANLQKVKLPADIRTKVGPLIEGITSGISEQLAAAEKMTCESQLDQWDTLTAPSTGMLNARTQPPTPDDNPCLLPPSAGYQRLENQLYRVEIHTGGRDENGDPTQPTFKWSRDNGTVVTLIESLSASQVTVRDVGPDEVLGFANGQLVEVIDDGLELNGQPGELIQITDVNTATRVITLASAPTITFDPARHPKLRRWDGAGGIKIDGTWQALEGGVEVQFADGTYAPGDYWFIPARTATGDIEWPRDATNTTIAQPRRGIVHHYCRLALVSIAGEQLAVTDCRKVFPPLTEQAFHVAWIGWPNDDLLKLQDLIDPGLKIRFDAPPDPSALNGGSFIVTLEPFPKGTTIAAPNAGLRDVFVLEGTTQVDSVDPLLVVWRPRPPLEKTLLAFQDVSAGQEARVRVRLMGQKLWSLAAKQTLYLDGQTFGQPGLRTDSKTPRTDLILPSGNGARAGDFESWFYLGNPPPPPPRLATIPTPATTPHPVPTPGVIPEQPGHKKPSPAPARRRGRRTP